MEVGEIGKPHGLSGETYVRRTSDDPERFSPGSQLIAADGQVLTVDSSRGQRDRFLVKFEGIDTRAGVEALRGPLYVSKESLRDLDEGAYWHHNLIRCGVFLTSGETIGRVSEVVPGPAQDLLAIEGAGGRWLVPAVKEIVVQVDIQSRRIVIDPPEGLLD